MNKLHNVSEQLIKAQDAQIKILERQIELADAIMQRQQEQIDFLAQKLDAVSVKVYKNFLISLSC